MLIIGLTGSIAMGKSAAARYLSGKGLPVFSADDAVYELYRGKAVEAIGKAFPGVIVKGQVDRELLAKKLVGQPDRLKRLEAIVHPLVEGLRFEFIKQHHEKGTEIVVLDIPLLFEKHLENKVDVILLVTASSDIQTKRAMQRPGMTAEKLAMIRQNQLDDKEKRLRADFIVDTSGPFEQTHVKLDQFLESVHSR